MLDKPQDRLKRLLKRPADAELKDYMNEAISQVTVRFHYSWQEPSIEREIMLTVYGQPVDFFKGNLALVNLSTLLQSISLGRLSGGLRLLVIEIAFQAEGLPAKRAKRTREKKWRIFIAKY